MAVVWRYRQAYNKDVNVNEWDMEVGRWEIC